MTYAAKDYAKLLGMAGFSETLLKNHFTLYQGYVTNTNKVLDTLAAMLKDGKVAAPPAARPFTGPDTPGYSCLRDLRALDSNEGLALAFDVGSGLGRGDSGRRVSH